MQPKITRADIEAASKRPENSAPLLLLVRGLPGSGKTSFAQTLSYEHCETDQFFTDEMGNYAFDKNRIVEAHEDCLQRTFNLLSQGKSVVVSNTFVRSWEMKKYVIGAMTCKHRFLIVEMNHHIIEDLIQTHDVPFDTLIRRKKQWTSPTFTPIEVGKLTVESRDIYYPVIPDVYGQRETDNDFLFANPLRYITLKMEDFDIG